MAVTSPPPEPYNLTPYQDWEDPSEFFGCGRFAADSWRIFCRGGAAALAPRDVEDATLQRYLRWARTGTADAPARKPKQPRAALSGVDAAKRRAGGVGCLGLQMHAH